MECRGAILYARAILCAPTVMLPYILGEGLPVVGGGGSVMTHTSGSVTTQSIAFKYVMAFEPYYFSKSVHGSLTMRCVK